jgi:F5/8 type C domain
MCALAGLAGSVRFAAAANVAPPRLIDAFESAAAWKPVPADGVEMKLSTVPGVHGQALRIDFHFVKGGGYAVLHRDVDLDLPANYALRFRVRGETPRENLEFKLVDSTGANVWWCNRRDFEFPAAWQTLTTNRRHFEFAWGPAGGGEIRHVAAIEFAITAGSGGQGTVWLDDLELVPLEVASGIAAAPVARASSEMPGHEASRCVDSDTSTTWTSRDSDARPSIEFDLGSVRDFGGLELLWNAAHAPHDLALDLDDGDDVWRRARTIRGGTRARDVLALPDAEARRIRLTWLRDAGAARPQLREVLVLPPEFGDSPESTFVALARGSRRGLYPRGYAGEQRFWTVTGIESGVQKPLFAEDGAVEVANSSFSIEPMLEIAGKLVTWADAKLTQSLESGNIPIPSVEWSADSVRLQIRAASIPDQNGAHLHVTYRLLSQARLPKAVALDLAVRPFQVNPPTQFLNHPGGVARIHALSYAAGVLHGDSAEVRTNPAPSGWGAATFDQGDIADYLARGTLPGKASVYDSTGFASGALVYRLKLAPQQQWETALEIPLREPAGAREANFSLVLVNVPDARVTASLNAQIGWLLLDRRGPSIRPGARAYARSWIRDGALGSAALLRMGHDDVVRRFIDWYAAQTYVNGKVPCCVGDQGADPVPEHDSEGEFVFLVAEYVRTTGDTALAGRVWPKVCGAIDYLDSLRAQRRTAEWRQPGNEAYFGLLPPSISHEGYSAKAQHSYWDDLFALRGYHDATELAGVLGDHPRQTRFAASGNEFARDLAASMRAAIAKHGIDYIPGCADLGDFDPTSTTIALDPVQAGEIVPQEELRQTFERYWTYFRDRRDGRQPWDAYTPYEMRTIGSFVRLGWRERADSLLTYFMTGQRPQGWRQWPEVVWHDERAPRFLGDLPHTWVGSDFVRSVLAMLAYENESDSSLVLAAGVPLRWARDPAGVTVAGLRMRWGVLRYNLVPWRDGYQVGIEPGIHVPAGGIRVAAPGVTATWTATINGAPASVSQSGEVTVRSLPAVIELSPRR